MLIVKGSWSSGKESAADSGKSTWTPTVKRGAVTINIINKTSITSTKGVTLISLIGSFFERFNLNAIINYIIDKNVVEDNPHDFSATKSIEATDLKIAGIQLENALTKMKNNLSNSRKKNEIMED